MSDPIKPAVGDVVLYVLPDGPSKGEARPAVIVRTFDAIDAATGMPLVNLLALTDHHNDGHSPILWRTSVHCDPAGIEPGTWHPKA